MTVWLASRQKNRTSIFRYLPNQYKIKNKIERVFYTVYYTVFQLQLQVIQSIIWTNGYNKSCHHRVQEVHEIPVSTCDTVIQLITVNIQYINILIHSITVYKVYTIYKYLIYLCYTYIYTYGKNGFYTEPFLGKTGHSSSRLQWTWCGVSCGICTLTNFIWNVNGM